MSAKHGEIRPRWASNDNFIRNRDIMCRAEDMSLDFTPIDSEGDDAFDFVTTVDMLRQDGWTGVTVTHPHKTEAADYAGRAIDSGAAHLGASNLLTFGPDLAGWNTDYLGFIAAWQSVFRNRGPGAVAVAGATWPCNSRC